MGLWAWTKSLFRTKPEVIPVPKPLPIVEEPWDENSVSNDTKQLTRAITSVLRAQAITEEKLKPKKYQNVQFLNPNTLPLDKVR